MGTFTRENTELAVDLDGVGQQHRAEDGGMIIALERWRAGLDTTEMFADLPDGACQEAHWGYVLNGSVTVALHRRRLRDARGRSGLLHPAGPQRRVDEDAEFVEFTQAEQTPGINTLEA